MGNFNPFPSDFKNPFLSPEREKLWEQLKKNAKPISKKELFKKAEELRKDVEK